MLVTRPTPDCEILGRALSEAGFVPILCPLMSIAPTPDAEQLTRSIGDEDLAFTSANGVRAFSAYSERRDNIVFAVGPTTAAAAKAAGFKAVHTALGDVASMADLIIDHCAYKGGAHNGRTNKSGGNNKSGRHRIIHIAGTHRAGDLASMLSNGNIAVERKVLYQANLIQAFPSKIRDFIANRPPEWLSLIHI